MPLNVNEIFYSIQGESSFAGLPCVFIRLSGCNLRCAYCDTRYAYEPGMPMTITEILKQIEKFHCPIVEVTGGEPLLQEETPRLIDDLIASGYQTLMETNGSFDISRVNRKCIKIIDIKCPGSQEYEKNDLNNLKRLQPDDQIKFVIGDREDYVYAKHIVKSKCADINGDHILFSPVPDKLTSTELAKWILEDHFRVRLHLQLHKIIWPDRERGV
jgi:7-carboxy-7-deazaguanine synthase